MDRLILPQDLNDRTQRIKIFNLALIKHWDKREYSSQKLMISFIYLRNAASRSLLSEQLVPSYHFHEAFSVSEAVWLCTQKYLGTIVIAENLDCSEVSEIESRYAIFCLKAHTTVNELLCQLAAA